MNNETPVLLFSKCNQKNHLFNEQEKKKTSGFKSLQSSNIKITNKIFGQNFKNKVLNTETEHQYQILHIPK